MIVMSEGFLLNSKYIKMGREEGGFSSFPHMLFKTFNGYPFTALRPSLWTLVNKIHIAVNSTRFSWMNIDSSRFQGL